MIFALPDQFTCVCAKHVAVTLKSGAAHGMGKLHQPGTVYAECGSTTPEIGKVSDQTHRHGNGIDKQVINRPCVGGNDRFAGREQNDNGFRGFQICRQRTRREPMESAAVTGNFMSGQEMNGARYADNMCYWSISAVNAL